MALRPLAPEASASANSATSASVCEAGINEYNRFVVEFRRYKERSRAPTTDYRTVTGCRPRRRQLRDRQELRPGGEEDGQADSARRHDVFLRPRQAEELQLEQRLQARRA